MQTCGKEKRYLWARQVMHVCILERYKWTIVMFPCPGQVLNYLNPPFSVVNFWLWKINNNEKSLFCTWNIVLMDKGGGGVSGACPLLKIQSWSFWCDLLFEQVSDYFLHRFCCKFQFYNATIYNGILIFFSVLVLYVIWRCDSMIVRSHAHSYQIFRIRPWKFNL